MNYTDSATSVPTLSLQETWLYRLPTVECGNTTQIPRSTCPSVTISVTGRSTSKEAAPPRGAASTSRTGTCAGNGAVRPADDYSPFPKRRLQASLVEHSFCTRRGYLSSRGLVCLKAGGRELPGKGHQPAHAECHEESKCCVDFEFCPGGFFSTMSEQVPLRSSGAVLSMTPLRKGLSSFHGCSGDSCHCLAHSRFSKGASDLSTTALAPL